MAASIYQLMLLPTLKTRGEGPAVGTPGMPLRMGAWVMPSPRLTTGWESRGGKGRVGEQRVLPRNGSLAGSSGWGRGTTAIILPEELLSCLLFSLS